MTGTVPVPSRRQITGLLASRGLRPRRALGQNFVVDPNTVRRIARLAQVGPQTPVLEIGAGLGSLTVALAETGAPVVALETDPALVELLREVVEPAGVRVLEADALTVAFDAVLAVDSRPWAVVANLPYNIAVPLVVRVLEQAPRVGRLLVMVQREVGERLAAPPGNKTYGAVSVKVAYHARAELVGQVPASVFVPRPNVESVLVRLERHQRPPLDPAIVPPDLLFALVDAGFAQRRKMLRRSVAHLVPPEAFAQAEVAAEARAEALSLEDWGRLAQCTAKIRGTRGAPRSSSPRRS